MSKKNSAVALPVLPVLPKSRSYAGVGTGKCLCGCPVPTKSRFAPGHDAMLLAWALRVEKGAVKEAPAPHTAHVAVEIKLRAKAGITGMSHQKALMQASDAPSVKATAKATRKPRLVPAAVVAETPVADVTASE